MKLDKISQTRQTTKAMKSVDHEGHNSIDVSRFINLCGCACILVNGHHRPTIIILSYLFF